MRVALVLDQFSLAVTGGAAAGISVGDELRVSDEVVDPETGAVIGSYPNLRVVVTEVFPRFCVAETLTQPCVKPVVTINVGDSVKRVAAATRSC